MAKKRNDKTSVTTNSDEMVKLGKIILIIVVICVIFYGITILITKYKKDDSDNYIGETTPAIIQYEEIVLGELLEQNENEYYVLVEDEDSPYNDLLNYYVTTYKNKDKSLSVYTTNLNSIFNTYYVSETSNLKVNDMTKFKVSDFSLIKIKNKKIIEAFEGIDEVEKEFKKLVK